MITCRTLGPAEITVDGAAAPPELLWRKNLALLVYLARSPARRRTRDHLIGLLWGDKTESAARHSLREAIRVLRRVFGEAGVTAEGDQVRLADGAVALDTDRFEQLAGAGDWSAAAALVAGDFLEGFSVPDASPFEDWLTAERTHWHQRSVEALTRHAEQRLAAGDTTSGGLAARQALRLEPASSRALHAAMTALALGGDRSAALAVFDAAPRSASGEAALQALAERLRRAREWRLPEYARAAGARGAESRRVPLLGRARELARILEQWAAVRANRRLAMIVIEADAGLGRTRLAEEVAARVTLEGGAVAAVRGVAADRAQPLSGPLGLARGGLLDAAGVAGANRGALAAFAAHATEWADRFAAVTRGAESLGVAAAFTDVLRAASDAQPVVLMLDDAQWLDDETCRALEAVARDLASQPVMVVLTATPQPAHDTLHELSARVGRDIPGITVKLGSLDGAALAALAHWALPAFADAEVERVTRRVTADSAGVPLLAVELLHAIALGLDLQATKGAWPEPFKTLDQTLPGELPDTIAAAIRVGFRRLSAPAQQVLTAAAVLGERVEAAALGRATRLEGGALHDALDELEWQRWLVAEPRGYAFVARIVADIVRRDMITAGQRQRLLQAAGE